VLLVLIIVIIKGVCYRAPETDVNGKRVLFSGLLL